MRRCALTIIGVLLLAGNVFSQQLAEQAKYELIRETINFLAADKTVSQDTTFRISCQVMDYACFDQQLSSKPIAGIERWYQSWRAVSVTDDAQVKALKVRIFSDIFDRPGKGYRKELKGYTYLSNVEKLLNRVGPLGTGATVPAAVPESESEDAEPAEGPVLAASGQSDQESAVELTEEEDTMIADIALIVALIALLVTALSVFRKKGGDDAPDYYEISRKLDDLASRLDGLERQAGHQPSDRAIGDLTEIMEAVERRVVALESGRQSGSNDRASGR